MKIKEFLKQTFIFSGVSDALIDEMLAVSKPRLILFKRGELVYSNIMPQRLVGLVIKGKCEVRREKSDGGKVVLNALTETDTFGVLSVFSPEQFPTQIYAVKNTEILFFSANEIITFATTQPQVSLNIIRFLVDRLQFLNKKIATFSGTRVEDRLASFLINECEKHGSEEFPFNCLKTAEEINAGRASVYRVLSAFEQEGLIYVMDKQINILDLEGLERIIQK